VCGIAGFIDTGAGTGSDSLEAMVGKMADTLRHRGPDDSGVWVDSHVGVALGHRRLSIVDTSVEGRQPMVSACGRYVMACNGEIYNFIDLRKELEALGHGFRGHSDTEVALTAISQWGVESAVRRFIGMFAIALWDRKKRELVLVRDRLGKKPLYYGKFGKTFMFGSELKALRAHSDFVCELNSGALATFLRHNYISESHSIYKNVSKLKPGFMLYLNLAGDNDDIKITPYWSVADAAKNGKADIFSGSEAEAVERLDVLLRDSVKMRMISDVPLGAFLSGGIDSSLVVALMQAQSSNPIKTFSIGFYEDGYNEADHAKRVADYLKTDHTELYVKSEEAMAVIPGLPSLYDEPFADVSQIPTFLVSKLARKSVTVSLSGDGGDELFAGYNRYFWGKKIWRSIGWAPAGLRSALANAIVSISPQGWDSIFKKVGVVVPKVGQYPYPGDKMHKLAGIFSVEGPEALYLRLVSHWKDPESVALNSVELATAFSRANSIPDFQEFTEKMIYLDMVTYLPDDILVKVDRASMGVGLEVRAPLLDHRVVEFAWQIPLSMKIKKREGKWLLRQVLHRYIPKKLYDRPKMGFGVPIDVWLRGSLREWADDLINEKRLRAEGIFDPVQIKQKWVEHLSGKRNWQYYLWDILMFQAWKENAGL